MSFFSVKQISELLELKPSSIYEYIRRGSINSEKCKNGKHQISEKELRRFQKERENKTSETMDHYCIKELEQMGIEKSLVLDGSIDAKKVSGKYYVHYKEVKRHILSMNSIDKTKPIKKLRKVFTVLNSAGIHMRPCAEIIRICSMYSSEGLEAELIYNGISWKFPSMGALELLSMSIPKYSKVIMKTEGRSADLCMKQLESAFKNKFNVKEDC